MGTRPLSFALWWFLLFGSICTTYSDISPVCPEQCLCSTTEEGLHKAACTSLSLLHKYSVKNKLHNINIITLHGAGVVKINSELDRFNEVVSIDISYNKIEYLNKLMRASKKLTHVNLSKNYLREFSAVALPSSVSSLDLSNNRLKNVPSNLETLTNLEHLLLGGNPLECSCHNIKILEHLREQGVILDDIECVNRPYHKTHSWKSFKVADLCSDKKHSPDLNNNVDLEDMMMGDQPADTEMIGEPTSDKKSMPMTDSRDLNTGEVFESSMGVDNDDNEMFLNVNKKHTPVKDEYEGSGDLEDSTNDVPARMVQMTNTEVSPTTEGSEGSGSKHESATSDNDLYDYDGSGDDETTMSTTTELFMMGPFNPFFSDHYDTSTDGVFETPESPSIFLGKVNWDEVEPEISLTTSTTPASAEVVEPEIVKVDSSLNAVAVEISGNKDNVMTEDLQESKPVKSSIGTYICIGLLLFILGALIGIVIIKNAIRKRRDKRYIRQQRKDVEKAGKEMVEMNKSLLGKPVSVDEELIFLTGCKKNNGNYELVPTHEPTKKNGTIDSRKSVEETPVQKAEAPKESYEPPINNVPTHQANEPNYPQDTTDSVPQMNGHNSPQLNGRHYPDSNLLGPPNEYMPIYDPDSGRVKIKLTETPKPKTPTLVTRSRSNAGDIIITPVSELGSPTKGST